MDGWKCTNAGVCDAELCYMYRFNHVMTEAAVQWSDGGGEMLLHVLETYKLTCTPKTSVDVKSTTGFLCPRRKTNLPRLASTCTSGFDWSGADRVWQLRARCQWRHKPAAIHVACVNANDERLLSLNYNTSHVHCTASSIQNQASQHLCSCCATVL